MWILFNLKNWLLMIIDNNWKQHFPTYKFSDRDIAIEEYIVSAKALESEERVFLNASNITMVASATFGSLAVSSSEKLSNSLSTVLPSFAIPIVLIIMVSLFSIVTIKYFADRQKSITFASRKIVILRRMLGLSYGRIQLVLPNWRIEGADQPLSIKLFPGWFSYVAYPFWILFIISSCIIFLLLSLLIKSIDFNSQEPVMYIILLTLIWGVLLSYIFRSSLLDNHETMKLIFVKNIAKIINLPISDNFEYLIYRATLASHETERMNVSLHNLLKNLIFIEDRDFYKHSGISYKAIGRGVLSLLKLKRRSGGSTIHQQLIRTLFILDLSKTKRRKLIEILLASWLNKVLTKKNILEMYISSVRFENKCFGVVSAMNHYFGDIDANLTPAKAFFLIERVSNIRQSLLASKIISTALSARDKNILSNTDLLELSILYKSAVNSGKIIDHGGKINRLVEQLTL